ncbi:MAG: hypothetical protein V1892_03760 [bacterium]
MPPKKLNKNHHHLIRRRCRHLHIINLIVGFLTIISLSSYFFLCSVGGLRAASMGFNLTILSGEITPTPQVEVTPIPGGIPNLPSLEVPIFAPGEAPPPHLRILKIDNLVIESLGLPIRITNSLPTFSGQTNIRNAILFIELPSLGQRIFTTYANENGFWDWQSPLLLGQGWQTINITALSPADPRVRAGAFLSFEIISEKEAAKPLKPPSGQKPTLPPIGEITPPVSGPPGQPSIPGQIATTTPPTAPGQPPIIESQPPTPSIEERVPKLISLHLQVLNKDKKIYPKEKVLTKTEILNLSPEPLHLDLKYEVISPQNEIVSTSNNEVDLVTALTVGKDYQTSLMIKAGVYIIRVETEIEGVIFSSQDKFEVIERPLIKLPGEVIITERQAAEGVLAISLILLVLLIYFLLLLRREYKKVLLLPPIDEKNLWQRGEIR